MLAKILYYTIIILLFFYSSFFTSFILYIHTTDSLFPIILTSFSICTLSSIFNIFVVLKLSKCSTTISPSYTSKKDHLLPQLFSLFYGLRIEYPLLLSLLPLSQLRCLSQFFLLLKSPLL